MTFNGEHSTLTMGRDLLLIVACLVALVLPFVLAGQILDPDDSGRSPTPGDALRGSTASGSTSAVTREVVTAPAPTASAALATLAEACRLANLRQQAPLSAADVSLAQFDKHIDAMNLLVAGKISLSVATTFWDETRVKATENAAAFRVADKELRASDPRCPAPDPAVVDTAPYGQVVAVKSCAGAIAARSVALSRARTAITTWEHHVHDMEMLRMGHITPAQATAAWQKSWKTGERQLHSYDQAATKAKKADCSLD